MTTSDRVPIELEVVTADKQTQTDWQTWFKRLLMIRFVNQLNDQLWSFAIPVSFAALYPNTIGEVSAFILVGLLVRYIFSLTLLGNLVDRVNHQTLTKVAVSLQNTFAIFSFVAFIILYQTSSVFWYWLLVCSDSIGTCFKTVSSLMVERDWLPRLVPKDDLDRCTPQFKTVDLVAEAIGPAAMSIVYELWGSVAQLTTCLVLNILTWVPELLVLVAIERNLTRTKNDDHDHSDDQKGMTKQMCSGTSFAKEHNLLAVIIGGSFFWITVLSPHGALLTTWLTQKTNGYVVGGLRTVGVICGLVGTHMNSILTWRPVPKMRLGATILACAVMPIAILFKMPQSLSLYIGLLFLVVSRIGLYLFTPSATVLKQTRVPDGRRGRVSAFDMFLCYVMFGVILVLGMIMNDASAFPTLTIVSACAVCVGTAIILSFAEDIEKSNSDQIDQDHVNTV